MSRSAIEMMVRFYPQAGEMTLYGERLDSLSREELMAAVGMLITQQSAATEEHIRRLERTTTTRPGRSPASGPGRSTLGFRRRVATGGNVMVPDIDWPLLRHGLGLFAVLCLASVGLGLFVHYLARFMAWLEEKK